MLTIEEIKQILSTFNVADTSSPADKRKTAMMGSSITKDQVVWFRNPFADENDQDNSKKPFYIAHVLKINGDRLSLRLTTQELADCRVTELQAPQFEIDIEQTMEYSKVAEQGIADMVDIDELNHGTLLHNLSSRYFNNQIYTYVGPILLAMNPFKSMQHLYTEEVVKNYKQIIQSKFPLDEKKSQPPHIFAITAMAFKQMMDSRKKQAIVISGESGAGKTESAKCAMKFLTSLSQGAHQVSTEPGIEQKILDTNPILEAFGNSKTVRNNNSSRFGKYVLLYFNQKKGDIKGARVKNYLLEKSRVIGPAPGERNYHVFYHLLRGATDQLLKDLGLYDQKSLRRLDLQDFNYLKGGADIDQTIINDVELYHELAHQFVDLGFASDEIMAVWRIVAATLHLGEIQFDDKTYDENGKPCSIVNMDRAHLIAKILGIQNTQDLVAELVNRSASPGSTARAPLKKNECIDSRDSLAKALYDNLFTYLVERMNLTILPENEKDEQFKLETQTIGLLDIFGFENFKDNHFEQMCINYVNEKLHKLYISAIFDAEKIELRNEGLSNKINELKYPDLTSLDVIKLLDEKLQTGKAKSDSKNGIFNIVNDCSTQKPRPLWEALLKKIDDQHKSSNVYVKVKAKDRFKIKHSAKEVIYDVKSFIERNVDEISPSLEVCITTKTDKTIANIFQGNVGQLSVLSKDEEKKSRGPAPNKKSIWQKFSAQMQDLMNELAEPLLEFSTKAQDSGIPAKEESKKQMNADAEECELHFIRCIKPNDFKIKDTFIQAMCLQQITYMGVLESVDLKQKNYPFRKSFEEFYQKYEILSPLYGTMRYDQMNKQNTDFKQLSSAIIRDTFQGLGEEFYAIGHNKILMRNEIVAVLEKAKSKAIKRTFGLFLGLVNATQNKNKLTSLQSQLKINHKELIDKRAKAFYEKAVQSIIKYKTEKRKDYESKAALVLADTYKKHMFRKQLGRSIKDRQMVVKSLANYALFMRLRKYYICFTATKSILDKAFNISKERSEQRAVRTVQRLFRGFQAREKKMTLVLQALKSKENLKLHVAAKKVQKRLKGVIVRKRLLYLSTQAQRIQGFIRMKWYRHLYNNLRSNVTTIQRGVRRFLARRDIIKDRLMTYLTQEVSVLNNVKQMEQFQLYGSAQSQVNSNGANSNDNGAALGLVKAHTPYSVKKIQLLTRVVDLHVLTDISEIYSIPWASQWNKICKECIQSESPIMSLTIASTHSLAVNTKGKIFSWGWNDNGQCGKQYNISEVTVKQSAKNAQVTIDESLNADQMKVKQAVSAQDRNFVLIQDTAELYTWGGNDKGQLGLGTYDDEYQPRKVEFFSKQNIKVGMVAAGGDLNLAACENGEGYAWPFQRAGVVFSLPVKMPFSDKVKISKVSCGYNFGFFISSQGLVYAVGKENSEGQLGLGHVYPRDIPELITSLKDVGERIDALECGFRHVIAKSTLGKVFTWGWGGKGQLGHGHLDSEMTPRLVTLERNKKKDKAIQIAAGYSHSIIMIENNRELLWCGSSGQLQNQCRLVTLRLSDVMPDLFPESNMLTFTAGQQIDFAVVKVNSSWSKSISMTTILIADLRAINTIHPLTKIQSTLQQLSTKWDPNEVMPPYLDTISGMFSANMMKMQGSQKTNTQSSKTAHFQSNKGGESGDMKRKFQK